MLKKILFLTIIFMNAGLMAQVPQALNYQAIARNADGTVIAGQSIGVRFTILEGSSNGTMLYQETHQSVTNNFGLFVLFIGKGAVVTGSFPAIDWGTVADKFLRVEIAPQGGGNYQLQGATQFLSVPYALYAEKTKLISGNGISIINGNTISANYQAGTGINITGTTISGSYQSGPGIAINGNTISANYQAGIGINITGTTISGNYQAGSGITINGNIISSAAVSNGWLLTGNAGTSSANFLGTTDNQPLYLRTNNVNRLMIDAGQPVTGGSLSTAFLSDFASIRTAPAQFAVYGKDVAGISIPVHLLGSVEGMTWTGTGGPNNTAGRFLRMTQVNSATYSTGNFFDFGVDQGISFYISNRGQNSVGGLLPRKMVTISSQDFVGINFNWGENPTANFHTKGTLRFEGINADNALTRLVAMDANGNVASRDASTLLQWTPDPNGIHYSSGNVGVGANSNTNAVFNVMGSAGFPYTLEVNSSQTWQTTLNLFNTTSNMKWYMTTGGSANIQPTYGVGMGNFGIARETISPINTTFPILIAADDKVGIGMGLGGTNNVPKTQLHIKTGDVYIEQITSGVIMKSPNGQCWRMTVSNAGAPVFTAISCP